MSEIDKLKIEMYDDVVKEKNKEYIELCCRFRETCNDIKNKDKEIERLNNIIKHVEGICESSIVSVNQILQDEKETKIVNGICINRNEYQIVRLKAYRTKSKEILGRIKELKGVDKE